MSRRGEATPEGTGEARFRRASGISPIRGTSGHRQHLLMTSTAARLPGAFHPQDRPGPVVTLIGALMALWCLGFAAVNLVFEATGHFTHGTYARYASGLSVMDWFVIGLKVLGAGVALLSIAGRPRFVSPAVVTFGVWAAFATLGTYALGSVAEAVGMVSGLVGSADQIDAAGVGYVLIFLAAAVGYGVLAVSYSRRHGAGKGPAILGALLAPAVLGLVLLGLPTLLGAMGLLPPP
jgi:hypothetical protein